MPFLRWTLAGLMLAAALARSLPASAVSMVSFSAARRDPSGIICPRTVGESGRGQGPGMGAAPAT